MARKALLLLNLDTGTVDGWYFDRKAAKEVLTRRREKSGQRWLLLSLEDGGDSTHIPDQTHAPTIERQQDH